MATRNFGDMAKSKARPVAAVGLQDDVVLPAAAQKPIKYTLLLDAAPAAALMEDEARLLSQLGYRPSRAEVFRALLAMLHEDQTILDDVARRMRRRT